MFAVANVGVAAATELTSGTDYTISGYNDNEYFTFKPEDNLLNDIEPISHYWYNVEEGDNEIALASTPTKVTDAGWLNNLGQATASTNVVGATQDSFAPSGWIAQQLFVKFADKTVVSVDDVDPNKQWYQINYKLPSKSAITDATISLLSKTNDALDKWTPQSYEYIFADTEEALVTGEGATTVLVDHTINTIKNITTVTLNTAVTAKYVAVRFYMPWNNFNDAMIGFSTSNGWYARWDRLDIHGTPVADTNFTDYSAAGVNTTNLSGTGKDAANSLIVDKRPNSAYFYNTIENSNGLAITTEPTAFVMQTDDIPARDIANLTSTTLTSQATLFSEAAYGDKYTKYMWAEYGDDGKVKTLIDDETKRWAQINYQLDGEAEIKTLIFGALANTSNHYWHMPGHYKIILSDTEAGLLDLNQSKIVIDVDEDKNATFKTNRHTIVLNDAVKAKYVALRFICMFNNDSIGSAARSNIYMDRINFFGVYGEYTNPVSVPSVEPTATAKDNSGNTLEGVTATVSISASGNKDESGDNAIVGATLSAPETATVSDKYYAFDGWYLGETKVADEASNVYALTGSEETFDFVAQYKQTYKPYTDFSAVGDNSKAVADAATSLLADKTVTSALYYNAIENHTGVAVTAEPTAFTVNDTLANITLSETSTADSGLFADLNLSRYMFKKYDAQNLISEIIDDEDSQWAQVNYTLDGEANISKLQFGNFRGSYHWQNASHYKYILSDTEAGLTDLTKANAVIEINTEENTSLKAGMQIVTLNSAVSAKYIGVRFISTANPQIIGKKIGDMYTDRMNYLGVYGTYTELADANVTYTVEGGAPETVVTKAEPVYSGNADSNGNYAAGNVTLTAETQYIDNENDVTYDFVEWKKGGVTYSVDNAITYDLTGEDAEFTAVYEEGTMMYALDFVDGTGKVIDTLKIAKNTIPTEQQMAAINEKVKAVYGYEIVTNQYGVDWGEDVYNTPATISKTYYAQYRNLGYQTAVTVTTVDGTKPYNNQNVAFDTAITVTDDAAAAWEMDGAVVATGTELKLYAAGTTMNVTATEEEKSADELAFVGKAMDNDNFSVFVHVNPTKTVKAYGVIFGSNTYKNTYDAQDENVKATMFVLDDTDAFVKTETKKPSLTDNRVNVTNTANVDFMTSLTDVATNLDGTYKTRHARAYVIYSDDSVVYSDVIISNK